MSISSRIYEIGRTPFVFTAQAADFVIDAATHIPDGVIATAHIAANAVTAAKIPDSVLTGKAIIMAMIFG